MLQANIRHNIQGKPNLWLKSNDGDFDKNAKWGVRKNNLPANQVAMKTTNLYLFAKTRGDGIGTHYHDLTRLVDYLTQFQK